MVYSGKDIEKIAKTGAIVGNILSQLARKIRPGITTKDLEKEAKKLFVKYKAKPSFLNYKSYPSAVCVSVNDQVVHGIPSDEKLTEGDIVGIDIGAYLDGFHADAAETFAVGILSKKDKKLIKVTKEALAVGIKQAKVGKAVGDIASAIQGVIEKGGFSVIKDCTGHGVGRNIHEDPMVPNWGRPKTGPKLIPGMVLAIEPMAAAGSGRVVTNADGWTVETLDQSKSAHFEHTVAITKKGPKILT